MIVGIAEKATTVQVAVQTPPSRRKHPSAPHMQSKMPQKARSYEPGTANKERDSKSRPHMNQILPQGNCDLRQIALQSKTNWLPTSLTYRNFNDKCDTLGSRPNDKTVSGAVTNDPSNTSTTASYSTNTEMDKVY